MRRKKYSIYFQCLKADFPFRISNGIQPLSLWYGVLYATQKTFKGVGQVTATWCAFLAVFLSTSPFSKHTLDTLDDSSTGLV